MSPLGYSWVFNKITDRIHIIVQYLNSIIHSQNPVRIFNQDWSSCSKFGELSSIPKRTVPIPYSTLPVLDYTKFEVRSSIMLYGQVRVRSSMVRVRYGSESEPYGDRIGESSVFYVFTKIFLGLIK